MARFLVKRLCSAMLTLFAVSVLTFLMFFALPARPGHRHVPEELQRRSGWSGSAHELGLDDPKVEQYAGYMKGIFVGRDLGSAQGGQCDAPCLGYSYVNNEPVTDTIARVLPVTLSIVDPGGGALARCSGSAWAWSRRCAGAPGWTGSRSASR